MHTFEVVVQAASVLGLAIALFLSTRQLKAATEQAKSSEEQAKASVRMAQLSLKQTELMRTQVYASFQPIVIGTGGVHDLNIATLTLKNVGIGPAIAVFGVYRSGFRQSVVGSLSVEQAISFQFDNSHNLPLRPVGPLQPGCQSVGGANRTVSLRLEYQSVSGANCWTTVDFKVGGKGAFVPENKHDIDLPSLTTNL
jgi:hypothetical protein